MTRSLQHVACATFTFQRIDQYITKSRRSSPASFQPSDLIVSIFTYGLQSACLLGSSNVRGQRRCNYHES